MTLKLKVYSIYHEFLTLNTGVPPGLKMFFLFVSTIEDIRSYNRGNQSCTFQQAGVENEDMVSNLFFILPCFLNLQFCAIFLPKFCDCFIHSSICVLLYLVSYFQYSQHRDVTPGLKIRFFLVENFSTHMQPLG